MSTKTERMYVIERDGNYWLKNAGMVGIWMMLCRGSLLTEEDVSDFPISSEDRVLPVEVTTTITLIGETK